MSVQLLISCVDKNIPELIKKLQLESPAVIINQCGVDKEEHLETAGFPVKVFYRNERGVGRSRNLALSKADTDICLFGDEDIVYAKGYEALIEKEFAAHPQADGIMFQVEVTPDRKTYQNDEWGEVTLWNCGRYPAYSMAFRREKLHKSGVKFSLLFGGGAPYSNGEDSLFIRQVIQAGMKIYKSPVCIGEEIPRPSTWFTGYHEKFFFDRGVLYHFLYGVWAPVWGFRFVFTKRKEMCREVPWVKAFTLLLEGVKQGKIEAQKEGNV